MVLDVLAAALYAQVASSDGSVPSSSQRLAYDNFYHSTISHIVMPAGNAKMSLEEYQERYRIVTALSKDMASADESACYTPKNGLECIKFVVKDDGTLVAAFFYIPALNKTATVEEPNILTEAISFQRNPVRIKYRRALSPNEAFRLRFWKNPYNITEIENLDPYGQKTVEAAYREYLKEVVNGKKAQTFSSKPIPK